MPPTDVRTRVRPLVWDLLPKELSATSHADEREGDGTSLIALEAALEQWSRTTGRSRAEAWRQVAQAVANHWASSFPELRSWLRARSSSFTRLLHAEILPYYFPRAPKDASAMPPGLVQEVEEAFAALDLAQGAAGSGTRAGQAAPHGATAPPTSTLRRVAQSAIRIPFLAATLIPVFVGVAIAAYDGHFDATLLVLTLVGVTFFHLGTNLADDYFEARAQRHESDLDGEGPARPDAASNALAYAALAAYGVGTLLGFTIVFLLWPAGFNIFWLGLGGFLLGLLYTAPPARLAHRGIGELAVAVGFGPLIVLGAYFVQAQSWSPIALLASLPIGFLIAAVLYINEFPDKEGDARVGKRTLIVRLPDRTAVLGYHFLLTLAYLTILAGVILRYFPAYTLGALATLPLAVRASVHLSRNYRFPYRLAAAHHATTLVHVFTGLLFLGGYVAALLTRGHP